MSLPLSQFEEYETTVPFKFNDHSLINSDINYFIYFKNRRKFLRINLLMSALENNSKAMYTPDMIMLLKRYIKSLVVIANFISKYNRKSPKHLYNANELSLNLTPFTGNTVKIYNDHTSYTFTIKNIIKIYKHGLIDLDSYYYLNNRLYQIKNPYTNEPFTLKQHLILFNSVKNFYFKIQKVIPQFILSFKMSYFDKDLYERANSNKLFYNSIKSFLNNLDNAELIDEFKVMLEYSQALHKFYCVRCFKGIDIRKHYTTAIGLYILNSNAIYCFGTFDKEFLRITRSLNIRHNINHRKQHRRFTVRRTRVNISAPQEQLLSTHPMAL